MIERIKRPTQVKAWIAARKVRGARNDGFAQSQDTPKQYQHLLNLSAATQ